MPFLNARGFTCVVNRLGLLGPFFPRRAWPRCDAAAGSSMVLLASERSLKQVGNSKYRGFPGKRGLCSENYLGATTVQGRVFTIQRRYFLMSKNARSNCGETGAGHQARTCKGNVTSHGRIRGISG